MTTLSICKDCTYYNLTITALEQHKKQTGHNFKVVHTSTDLKNVMPKSKNTDPENYKKAFSVLLEYWEFIPDLEKNTVDKKLKGCGL